MSQELCGISCESSELFGRSGQCVDNFTCVCPEGFSGVDDWTTSNDCHVNDILAFGLHLFHNICVFLGILSNSVCIVMLGKRWGFYFPFSSGGFHTPDLTAADKQLIVKNQSLAVCYFDLFYNITAVPYQFPFLLKIDGRRRNMEDGYPWQNISLALATSSILAACYALLLAWYLSLPDMKLRALLGLPTFLQRYPKTIYNLSAYMVVGAFLGGQMCLVILPGITGSTQKFDPALIYIFIAFMFLYCLVFEVIQCFFVRMFVQTFQSAIFDVKSKPSSSTNLLEKQTALLKSTIYTANLFSNALSAVVVGALLVLVVWLCFQGRQEYIFFSIIGAFPNIGSLFTPLILLRRTNGGLIPLVIKDSSVHDAEMEML